MICHGDIKCLLSLAASSRKLVSIKDEMAASTIYKAAVSLCVCVCLYPPFFRHDRRIATKFGMHMRIDPAGNHRIKKTFDPPHGSLSGVLGGQKFTKVGEMS